MIISQLLFNTLPPHTHTHKQTVTRDPGQRLEYSQDMATGGVTKDLRNTRRIVPHQQDMRVDKNVLIE